MQKSNFWQFCANAKYRNCIQYMNTSCFDNLCIAKVQFFHDCSRKSVAIYCPLVSKQYTLPAAKGSPQLYRSRYQMFGYANWSSDLWIKEIEKKYTFRQEMNLRSESIKNFNIHWINLQFTGLKREWVNPVSCNPFQYFTKKAFFQFI